MNVGSGGDCRFFKKFNYLRRRYAMKKNKWFVWVIIAVVVLLVIAPVGWKIGSAYYRWGFGKTVAAEAPAAVEPVAPAAVEPVTPIAVETEAPVAVETAAPVNISGSKLTIVFNNGQERSFWMSAGDFDLEDRQEIWDLLKTVGASDVVIETSENLMFFYNGYYVGVEPGITHMGEIIPVENSATAGYNAGFAVRYLTNGCPKVTPEHQVPLRPEDQTFFDTFCQQ